MERLTAPEGKSLIESMEQLEQAGYTGQFVPNDEAMVRCTHCQQSFPASELKIDHRVRMEGASDPSEMALVLGAVCPSCGQLGTLTLSYGPEASAEDVAVLRGLGDLGTGESSAPKA